MGAKETQFQPPSTVTDRFYSALKSVYGSKFSAQFNTAQEVHQSKAMWGPDIDAVPESQLRACLQNAKREMMAGNPNYQWPNMGLILGHAVNNSDWERACHKTFDTSSLIEDKTYAEKRKEKMQAEIKKLREAVNL